MKYLNDIISIIKQKAYDNKLDIIWIDRYIKFVRLLVNKNFDNEYLEQHHILPKYWDGYNFKLWNGISQFDNVINIPTKYHVILHHLLARTEDKQSQIAFFKIIGRIKCSTGNVYFPDHIWTNLIKESNSYNKNYHSKAVINLITLEEFPSSRDAARSLGLSEDTVGKAIKTKTKAGGYYWQFKEIVDQSSIEEQLTLIKSKKMRTHRYVIKCIENDKIYNSATEAAKDLNLSEYELRKHIKINKSYKNYHFEILDD